MSLVNSLTVGDAEGRESSEKREMDPLVKSAGVSLTSLQWQ